jgi:hypothetical protein
MFPISSVELNFNEDNHKAAEEEERHNRDPPRILKGGSALDELATMLNCDIELFSFMEINEFE